mgnify:CR=1 FL=1
MERLRFLTYPLSLLYNFITALRNGLYYIGILKSFRSGTPTICVGNLSTGGTGKSPHIEWLIDKLRDSHKIAVLSRGYRRKTKGYQLATLESTASEIGDEPMQFKQKYPSIQVAVDENRVNGIQCLIQKFKPDVILLDDAYQHRRVDSGFKVLLTEYQKPFFKDFVLAAGNLRENRMGAKRSDIVVVTKCPKDITAVQKQYFQKKIKFYTKSPVVFSHVDYNPLKAVWGDAIAETKYDHIIALTGIAKPDMFVKSVKDIAGHVQHHKFPDHYAFKQDDMEELRASFEKIDIPSKAIITTEKDAMRLKEFEEELKDLPIYYWPISIAMSDSDIEVFDKKLNSYLAR